MCGALFRYQDRAATAGLTLALDGSPRVLTVHHLFDYESESHPQQQSPRLSISASVRTDISELTLTDGDMVGLGAPWVNDDDEYDDYEELGQTL